MNNRIVFIKNNEVYAMNADGTSVTAITSSGGTKSFPVLSPDGSKIAFGWNGNLYVINANGTNSRQLTYYSGADSAGAPTWSPDSKKLAFYVYRTEGLNILNEIWTVNGDGSNRVKLIDKTYIENFLPGLLVAIFQPAWSPDGQRIAFGLLTVGTGAGYHLYYVDLSKLSDGPVALDTNLEVVPLVSWSPNGQKLAYAKREGVSGTRIMTINRDGTGATQIISNADSPAWLPDGSKIAFKRGSNIYTASSTGTGETLVHSGGVDPGGMTGLQPPTNDDFCQGGTLTATSRNPIALRDGEKRLEETDFQVTTPGVTLDFTRSYRQNQQSNPHFQQMGLGWTHNHNFVLIFTENPGDLNQVTVIKANGDEVHFIEDDIDSDHYVGESGSVSVIDFNTGTNLYIMTISDKSQYTFDIDGKLVARSWPSGELWEYVYANDQLFEVRDAYGRKLIFRYYSAGDHEGQLYRVGDHTFDDTGSLTGRYIEFGYVLEKVFDSNTGLVIDGEHSLLTSVKDVRGNTWSYEYYDQADDTADLRLLNFLIKRVSPPVIDANSDGQPDTPITLESLNYTLQGEDLAVNGDMEDDSDWASVGTPDINEQVDALTGEVHSGTYSRHVDAPTVGDGIEGTQWNMLAGLTYIITARVYPVSGAVKMQVTGETAFTQTSSGTGGWQTLRAKHTPETSVTNKQLQFLADATDTEFYVDSVSILQSNLGVEAIHQERGEAEIVTDFEFQPEGYNITTETVANKTTTHHFSNGVYAGPEDAAGNYGAQTLDLQYRPRLQSDANGNETQLSWSDDAKRLDEVADAAGAKTSFDYDSSDRLEISTDSLNRKTHYIYDHNARQPTLILVGVDAEEIDLNGGMETSGGWSDVGSPSINERLTSQVDSGNHARHVITDAADEGIQSVAFDLQADQKYTIQARVFVVSGEVKMQIAGITEFDAPALITGQWLMLSKTHTLTTPASGKQLEFLASGGPAEFYIDSVSIITTATLNVNGDMELDSGWSDVGSPTANERSSAQVEGGIYSRHVVTDAADEGIQSVAFNLVAHQTYSIRARVYPVGEGSTVKLLLVDSSAQEIADTADISQGIDAWETLSCEYTPTGALTDVRVQFVTPDGAAVFYADSLSIQLTADLAINGNMKLDSGWSDVGTLTANEQSIRVDSGEYFRHVVGDNTEGIESIAVALAQNHTYLLMARVFLVTNKDVKMQVTNISGFDATVSESGSWQTLRSIHKVTDIEEASENVRFIAQDDGADFYVDSVHLVDLGIIPEGLEDEWRWQEFQYDQKGRTVAERTINPLEVSLVQEITRSYCATGNGAGLLHQLTQTDLRGSNDVTTTYTYDRAGRVVKTQQTSNFGSCEFNYTVYDPAGNVLAAICNYKPDHHATPLSAEDAVSLYDLNKPEENLVTTYAYDPLGRRVATTTNAGAAFAQTTRTLYDALNRVWRTISNVVDASYDPPGDWVWENGGWKDGVGGTAIDHGTDSTQNIIQDTEYNAWGQVRWQRDTLGHVTLFGYDDANRLVKTVQNASSPAYDNDSGGDPDLSAYTPGSNPDEDVITTNTYDAVGNLVQTTDALGAVHFTVYDALNRPVKTVRTAKAAATLALNPGDGGYDATNDPRSASYTPSSDPDRDQITTTEYDALGRVVRTQRLLENRPAEVWETTLYGYDTLGRQIKVIRFASDPDYDVLSDPDLSAYSASPDPDEDMVSLTVYDDHGRVLYNEDTLQARTWIGYDGLGRQTRTIANAVGTAQDGGSNDPRSASYTPSSAPDQDLISQTVYDASGRVQSTEDVLGRVTYNVYDGDLGRVIRTIRNYVAQGMSDPQDWAWDAGDDRWEDGAGSAISHGTDGDENLISETVYDARGRVEITYDHRHNATRFVYDVLGRRVMTITNYVAQGMSDPQDWAWDAGDDRWEDGAGSAISHGSANDQNLIATTTYDLLGRVTATRDAAGHQTRFSYDGLGRRTQTIANYVDGLYSSAAPDEDLISSTDYNRGGQVIRATDARGTETAFTYDTAGRRLTVTQAANSDLATTSYTCYDKAGRVLRTIQNWEDDPSNSDPDARDGSGNWLFAPQNHGSFNDRNLIVAYAYDSASRRIQVTNPAGQSSQTAYFKDGQVRSLIDPEGILTQYRYDGLRRRTRVVAGFVDNGEDPQDWVWDAGGGRWEESDGTPLVHGTNNDQNVIVDVAYDKGGRLTAQRDPNGHLTTYTYDALDRRLTRTNPLSKTWTTVYADLFASGATRTTLTDPNGHATQRDFDRLGRLSSLQYGAPGTTPDVQFAYDLAGMRTKMSEYSGASFTNRSRETTFSYDDARRLTAVGFDTDGDGSVEESVSYEYDAGGLRTKLTLPGSLNIAYTYDAKGQLIGLTDWDSQNTEFVYDAAGRHIATLRANGLRSRYSFDAGGRLRSLRHMAGFKTFAHFAYEVDQRGNRIQALECLAHPATSGDTTIAYDDKGLLLKGAWSAVSGFQESTSLGAALKVMFLSDNPTGGNAVTLTMGTGPDHGIYDVYVGGSLWQSFDGYAASASEVSINIPLKGEGPHLLEIRSRHEKNTASSGYKVRFKQLVVLDRAFDLHTIEYTYDALSRLREARYNPNINTHAADADLLRRYQYAFDRAGNRTQQIVTLAGSPTTTPYTYNAANQLTGDGVNTFTYDDNGNLTSDGVNSYTWDRANRLLTAPGSSSYKYDALGNRIQQTVSSVVTAYLLDLQPGLVKVLREADGVDTRHFIHAPRGVHAQYDGVGWQQIIQDGLGSVRSRIDSLLGVDSVQSYDPYGNPDSSYGAGFGFTGEQTDGSGQVFLRARYYTPTIGVFNSLDPFEGLSDRPMSLNGYSWVEGNPVNGVIDELIFHNRYSYANGNPINFADPSGYCVGCETDFRVNLSDAGLPNQRDDILNDFKNRHWSFSGDIWDVLGREIDFVRWLQSSGRLSASKQHNWYDMSDAYLAASRFAGERLANYVKEGNHCSDTYLGQLEPGVAEWAAFILFAENYPGIVLELQHLVIWDEAFVAGGSTSMNIGFWLAHNTALREGVRRADAAGLRSQEPPEERTLINVILYNVLEPGDQCAAGNMGFCAFTFPFELNIGAYNIYPQHYPATSQDLDGIFDAFAEIQILWIVLGGRYPNPQIHLIR